MTAFETAKKNDVVIVVEPLANIYAYYNKLENQKFIHINDSLPECSRKYLTAHMLYFALHQEDEFHLISKEFTESEKAALKFAIKLLNLKENLSEEDTKKIFKRIKEFWGIDVVAQCDTILNC